MTFFGGRRQPENDTPEETAKSTLPNRPIGFETVLGAGSEFSGEFTSGGNVRIDGTFTGKLDIQGNILVGETAQVNANIEARNISIAGAVRGHVDGNKVQVLRTGRIWGDISANALTTEEGAFIDGKISMQGHVASGTSQSADEALQPDVHIDGHDSEHHDSIDSSDVDVVAPEASIMEDHLDAEDYATHDEEATASSFTDLVDGGTPVSHDDDASMRNEVDTVSGVILEHDEMADRADAGYRDTDENDDDDNRF